MFLDESDERYAGDGRERTLPEESEGAAGEEAAAAVDGVTVEDRGGLEFGRRGVDMGVDMVSQDHDRSLA